MARPIGIKETQPRKQIPYIPGEASWKRFWRNNHYKELGLSLENYKEIASRDCFYCGSSPPLVNAHYNTFHEYLKHNGHAAHESWWNNRWIHKNGIDKVVPAKDYSDLTNLVPCCRICNWMKGLLGQEEFLKQINKIYHHKNHDKISQSIT